MDAVIGLVGVVVGAAIALVGQWWFDRQARARTLRATRGACEKRIDNIRVAQATGEEQRVLPPGPVRDEVSYLGADFDRFMDAQAQSGTRDLAFEDRIRRIVILHELPAPAGPPPADRRA